MRESHIFWYLIVNWQVFYQKISCTRQPFTADRSNDKFYCLIMAEQLVAKFSKFANKMAQDSRLNVSNILREWMINIWPNANMSCYNRCWWERKGVAVKNIVLIRWGAVKAFPYCKHVRSLSSKFNVPSLMFVPFYKTGTHIRFLQSQSIIISRLSSRKFLFLKKVRHYHWKVPWNFKWQLTCAEWNYYFSK